MNNLLRKITAGLLSTTMILSGMGTFPTAMSDLFVYAGGGSDDTPSVNRNANSAAYVSDGSASTQVSALGNDWYVLDVSTGIQPGDCVRNIVISYTDNWGVSHKQVLTPGMVSYPSGYIKEHKIDLSYDLLTQSYGSDTSSPSVTPEAKPIYDTSNSESPSGYGPGSGSDSDQNVVESSYDVQILSYELDSSDYAAYTGSRFASYSALFLSGLKEKLEPYTRAWLRNTESFVSIDQSLKEKYKDFSSMMKVAPFASMSMEHLLFKTGFSIKRLDSVAFYCEAVGNDSWDLNGWSLYSVDADETGFPQLQLNTVTFLTDTVGFDFAGRLIARSTSKGLSDSLGFVNAGLFHFGRDGEYTFTDANTSRSDENQSILIFSINIMDEYQAGIDSFNKTPSGNLSISEMLTARIRYKDTSGFVREVGLPVFTNAVMDIVTTNSGTPGVDYVRLQHDDFLSYAQQGESIVFSASLPEFSSLESMILDYNNPLDDKDTLLIKDITVYDNWGYRDYARRESYTVNDRDASGKPITMNASVKNATQLYRSEFVSGGTLLENKDAEKTFTFEKTSAGDSQQDYSNSYLVSINTSDVNFADTTDDVIVSFGYVSLDGKDMRTQEYSLQECCRSFYGYNPGENAAKNIVDANYNYCMRQGGTLKFIIDVKNLDHFTGMSVHLDEGSKDDWQMGSVEVSRIYSVGRRTVAAHSGTYGRVTVNRIYDREVSAQRVYFSDTRIYVQPGVTEDVDLEKGHYSTETERRDMSEYYYEMDYQTATSELHFDENAWKYQVIVNVQKNSVSGTTTDDCGSNNLFYFQLVFEKGTSAFILANQQLKHDCFRAGEPETFNVTINENLGELVSVNIIPDDVTDDADKMDKLCIDSIEVIKCNPDTANKRYVCENVGWINVVYSDNNEEVDKAGRYSGELITAVPVDYSGYMLALEFDLAIDSYTDADGVTGEQFVGGMKCNVAYRTSSGERKTTGERDLVSLLYDYAGRMGTSDDTYGTISDPSFMFRANHINRFILDISDAAVVESITLSGKPMTNCDLPIGGIAVKILKSDGGLIINSNGDFEKIYNIEPALLTDEIPGRKLPHKFNFTAGMYTSYTFTFGENELPELDTAESLNSIVSRLPQSCNDTLNLYIYMKEGVAGPSAGGYSPVARIYYSSVSTSNTYVNECSNLKTKSEGGRTVLYAQGLSASNISVLTNVKLSADNALGDNSIKADYAIVQQVRNGVAINTYKIYFAGEIITRPGGISMSAKCPANILGYTQTVALRLGEGTKFAKLVPEEYDIALAIKYTSKTSNDGSVLKSAYAFASDSGILSIQEGSIVEFTFNEAYIDQIVGVELIAMNGLDVVADGGNVVCRYADDDTGEVRLDGWYSMGTRTVIGMGDTDLPITSVSADDVNSLKRAKFTFTTMSQSSTVDSGGTAPIRMIIAYRSTDERNVQTVIDDIRACASGGFAACEEASVDIFLKGIKSLNYIQLIPYDEDPSSVASWNLQSVSFSLEGSADSSEHSMPVGRTIYESEDTVRTDGNISNYINLSTMTMGLKRSIGNESVYDDKAAQEISVVPGTTVNLGVSITGGNSGYYAYFMDRVTGGNREKISEYKETYGVLNLTFDNSSDETQVYRVTVFSVENPTIQVILTVNVTPAKIEESVPETPPVTPASEEGSGNAEPVQNPGSESNTDSNTGNLGASVKNGTKKREEETSLDA